MVRVCIVCLGNICRSPTAEGTLRHVAARERLAHAVAVESRGTGDWHVGDPPDPRTLATARARGVELTSRAKLFTPRDLERFDWVLPVDVANLRTIERMARGPDQTAKLRLLRSFEAGAPAGAEVPDPYYGGPDGFDHVFDICMRASEGLIAFLRTHHRLG